MNTTRCSNSVRSAAFDRNSRNFPVAYFRLLGSDVFGPQEMVANVAFAKVFFPVSIDNGYQVIGAFCKKHVRLFVHMRHRKREAAAAGALVQTGLLVYGKRAIDALGAMKTTHGTLPDTRQKNYGRLGLYPLAR